MSFKYYSNLSPKFEVIIDDSLAFTCALFGCVLLDTHEVYKQYNRSVTNITLSGLLKEISNFKICNGLAAYTSGKHLHSLSCELDIENYEQSKVYHRAQDCELIIIPEYTVCEVCMKHQKNIEKSNSRMQKNINKPGHLNAPLSNTHPNRAKLALQEERMKSSKLLAEVE